MTRILISRREYLWGISAFHHTTYLLLTAKSLRLPCCPHRSNISVLYPGSSISHTTYTSTYRSDSQVKAVHVCTLQRFPAMASLAHGHAGSVERLHSRGHALQSIADWHFPLRPKSGLMTNTHSNPLLGISVHLATLHIHRTNKRKRRRTTSA